MTTEAPVKGEDGLRERVPRARCHACGKTTIVALCCTCGRFLCAKHDKVTDLASRLRKVNSLTRRLAAAPAPAGRTPAAEPAAARLSPSPVTGVAKADTSEAGS